MIHPATFTMVRILFICVGNMGRSQLAEAFAKHYGDRKIEVMSAGTRPGTYLTPNVVKALKEKGIDISGNKPKKLEPWMLEWADIIVTLCPEAASECPPTPAKKTILHWNIKDPFHLPIEEVREIRDEIERKVKKLIEEIVK